MPFLKTYPSYSSSAVKTCGIPEQVSIPVTARYDSAEEAHLVDPQATIYRAPSKRE